MRYLLLIIVWLFSNESRCENKTKSALQHVLQHPRANSTPEISSTFHIKRGSNEFKMMQTLKWIKRRPRIAWLRSRGQIKEAKTNKKTLTESNKGQIIRQPTKTKRTRKTKTKPDVHLLKPSEGKTYADVVNNIHEGIKSDKTKEDQSCILGREQISSDWAKNPRK